MSNVLSHLVPPLHGASRGAGLAGWLRDMTEAYREYRHLRAEAHRLSRIAREREDVLHLARQLSDTQPGMASDLIAAVNRDGRG